MVVDKALDEERLGTIRRGCDHVIREMVTRDPARVSNRGSHRYLPSLPSPLRLGDQLSCLVWAGGRYSFGHAMTFFGCAAEWSVLIDPPVVSEALTAIFDSPDYFAIGCA